MRRHPPASPPEIPAESPEHRSCAYPLPCRIPRIFMDAGQNVRCGGRRRNRRAGGGNQLALHREKTEFQTVSGGDLCHRRHRDRQQPVLTTHAAVTFAHLGKNYALHRKIIQADGRGSDIDDGIHRSRFVGNAPDSHPSRGRLPPPPPVPGGIRFAIALAPSVMDEAAKISRISLRPPAHGREYADGSWSCPCSWRCPWRYSHVMIEKFPVLWQLHQKITDVQTGFFHSADMYLVRFLYGERPQGLSQNLLIRSQVQKRRYSHIAADTAGALKI